jgi:flavin-dependent dehydrogenase
VEQLLDFSIAPVIERRITTLRATVDLAAPFVSAAPRPWAYMVMRDTFDQFLLDQAARAGAAIYADAPVTALQDRGTAYRLTTPQTEFMATYVIGADGATSTVRKLVGAPPFRRVSVAIERELTASPAALAPWSDTLALDFGHLRSGYAWVFPKATNFSVGVGGPRSVAKELRPYYAAMLAQYAPELGNTTPYITAGHPLPIRVAGEPLVYGRTLLVGDAAGLIEPLAGEGIYYAIRSGQLAAAAIVDAATRGPAHLARYAHTVDTEIQPELEVASACLVLLDLAPQWWVPWLLKQSHPFWHAFYRIFTGEQRYQDLPRTFGRPGAWLVAAVAHADRVRYHGPHTG